MPKCRISFSSFTRKTIRLRTANHKKLVYLPYLASEIVQTVIAHADIVPFRLSRHHAHPRMPTTFSTHRTDSSSTPKAGCGFRPTATTATRTNSLAKATTKCCWPIPRPVRFPAFWSVPKSARSPASARAAIEKPCSSACNTPVRMATATGRKAVMQYRVPPWLLSSATMAALSADRSSGFKPTIDPALEDECTEKPDAPFEPSGFSLACTRLSLSVRGEDFAGHSLRIGNCASMRTWVERFSFKRYLVGALFDFRASLH